MQTLKELQLKNNYSTDKESTHHYLDIYDRLFAPFKDKEINLLEVGIASGGSLKLWDDYFTNANIVGIDFINEMKYEYSKKVKLCFEDIHKIDFEDNCTDIAIDDGSHLIDDQIYFIKTLFWSLRKGGLLIIEDIDNIDQDKHFFNELNVPFEIIDLRKETDRYDSVLLIFKK